MGFISMIWPYLGYVSEAAFLLMIVSTAIVRMTPSKEDDDKLNMINSRLQSFLSWFPTFGKNPRTKALESLYNQYKKQIESSKSDDEAIKDQLKK